MIEEFNAALVRFRSAYDDLFMLLGNYPVEHRHQSGACGDWTPKQVVAHLSGWIVEAHRRYSDFAEGDEDDISYEDDDAFNARSVAERENADWNAVITELRGLTHDLSLRAAAVPQSLAESDDRYTDWLVSLREDCELHFEQLSAFIGMEV